MPTIEHHTAHLQQLFGSMFASTSDKLAWAAAGGIATGPLWGLTLDDASSWAVKAGPILAAAFVGAKILLTFIQIVKETIYAARAARGRPES